MSTEPTTKTAADTPSGAAEIPAAPELAAPAETAETGTVERMAQPGRTPRTIIRDLIESSLYPVPGSPGMYYSEDLGSQGLYKRGNVKAGEDDEDSGPGGVKWTLVLPRIPVVTENYIELDDAGEVVRQYFTLAAGRDTARAVNLADLRTGDAWTRLPDLVGTGSRTMRDTLVSIVTDQAERVPRMYAVSRTGMHTIDGRRVYVYPDGRTYPAGLPVRVMGVSSELAAAAGPLGRQADDAEIRDALADVSGRGWHTLFALGIGARSFGYSIRPVAGGAGVFGDPGSGKTLSGGIARKLILTCAYPPIATAAFSDTITDIECKVAVEADMPILVDDLALTADSSMVEISDGKNKVEMLFRGAGNQKAMRGRRRKDLTAQEERRVGSIPFVTAQQMPRNMQASLYRRTVLPRVSMGDIDSRWFLADQDPDGSARVPAWRSLDIPLRTLGDRIVRRLVDLGAEAGAWIDSLNVDARRLLGPELDKVLDTIPPELETVIAVACASVAGLLMLADAAGVKRSALLAPMLGPLAAEVARQGDVIADRQDTADNLATAISDVVRAALLGKRAHVRNVSGVIEPCVPGQTEQAQGVAAVPGSGEFGKPVEWSGSGVAFYADPAADTLMVRATELHGLCAASSDQRVKGYSVQTLPAALLRAGAILPSPQKDSPTTVRARVPGDGSQLQRCVLLRGSVLWHHAPAGPEPTEAAEAEPVPAGPGPTAPEPAALIPAAEQSALLYSAYLDEITDAVDPAALASLGRELAGETADQLGFSPGQVETLRAAYSRRLGQLRPALPAPRPAEPVRAATPEPQRTAEAVTSGNTNRGGRAGTGSAPADQGRSNGERATYRTGRRRSRSTVGGFTAAVLLTLDGGNLAADVDGIEPVPATLDGLAAFIAANGPAMRVPAIAPYGQGSDGMIVLDAAAARSLGLGSEGWTATLTAPAASAGLTLGRPAATHVKVFRRAEKDSAEAAGDLSVTLVNMAAFEDLAAAGDRRLDRIDLWSLYATRDGRPDGAQLARLMRAEAASPLGDVPVGSSSGAGLRLLTEVHPREVWTEGPDGKKVKALRADALPDNPVPCPPAAGSRHPLFRDAVRNGSGICRDEDYRQWTRPLTEAETAMPFVVGLDRCLSFVAGMRDLKVPVGQLQPVDGYRGAGFFRADLRGLPVEPDLPHFATADGMEPSGPDWYSSETIDYAAKEYGYDTALICEGYATEHTSAIFTGFSDRVRDAYLQAMAAAGVDPAASGAEFVAQYAAAAGDGLILAKGRKQRYKGLIGRLTDTGFYVRDDAEWLETVAAQWWYRPDVRLFVVSAARLGTHRMIRTARKLSGRAPVAVDVDCVLYAADSADPAGLATFSASGRPAGLRLGIRPGYCKPNAAVPMAAWLGRDAAGLSVNKLIHRYDATGAELAAGAGDDDAE